MANHAHYNIILLLRAINRRTNPLERMDMISVMMLLIQCDQFSVIFNPITLLYTLILQYVLDFVGISPLY